MTKPAIRVLKQPPRPMGVPPIRHGVLQQKLLGEQSPFPQPNAAPVNIIDTSPPEPQAPSREGWIEAPLEPTEAMLDAAGLIIVNPPNQGVSNDLATKVWTAMINARFDEPSVDTQALFGASSSEIKAALTLYRKMKAPRKRKAKNEQ